MMNTKHSVMTIVFLFYLLLGSTAGWSQSSEPEDFSLTWQELQELLKLDTDEIRLTWAEFQTLLRQTGNQVDIDFKDKEGIVTLKHDQFRQLLSKMEVPGEKLPLPPKAYIITEAVYSGIAEEERNRFSATFKMYVFERNEPVYVVIPIVHANVALRDIQVDGAPAAILPDGNWHSISLTQPGYHEVKAVFSVERDKHSISLPLARSVINLVDFTIFDNDVEIDVNPSLNPKIELLTDGTRFSGYAPSTDQLRITWARKSEKKIKRPALFYANTRTLLSTDADILRIKTDVVLEVIQSSLNSLSLLVPKNYEVVNVNGEAVSEWRVRKTDIGQVLEIPFRYEINRSVNFSVHAERILTVGTLASDFTGIQVLDARRETGEIGIVAESAVEVQVQESQELQKLEYQKLPQSILAMSSRPVLFAFKYAKHPYQLDISITKHEPMEGITTVIESAEATALFLKEGKILYHIVYTVRNTFKQFMELTLAPDAVIWMVYVDNKRAKASRNEQGNVLISLVRSSGDGIKPFHVELMYTLPVGEFGVSGNAECLLPATDIFINKMRLSMHVPPGFRYEFEKGEWEEAAVVGWYKDDGRSVSETGNRRDRSQVMSDTTAVDELSLEPVADAELESSGALAPEEPDASGPVPPQSVRPAKKLEGDKAFADQALTGPAGLSSIKVHLPLSGDHVAFTKSIVDKYETFPLQFSYTSKAVKKGIVILISIAVFIGFCYVLFRMKKLLYR